MAVQDTAPILAPEDIAAFRNDGVVHLKSVFDQSWLDLLRAGIEQDIASPSENFGNHAKDPGAPAYYEDFWCWSKFPQFGQFVRQSPCAAIAAQLLAAKRINLVMDNWFVREAGSASRPPFHHDISYFDFTGSMCVLWLPLGPVAKQDCISFVKGSHLWGKHFLRVRFADGHFSEGAQRVNGIDYEPTPDIEGNPEAYDLVQFEMAAGDALYFDMRTLHGSASTILPKETVHRYTLRLTAEDGRIQYRGDWAKDERAMFEARGYRDGDALTGDFFPQLWPV